jgi:lipid-A-disaccharide synthase-like uncharacterized protein
LRRQLQCSLELLHRPELRRRLWLRIIVWLRIVLRLPQRWLLQFLRLRRFLRTELRLFVWRMRLFPPLLHLRRLLRPVHGRRPLLDCALQTLRRLRQRSLLQRMVQRSAALL